LGLIKIHQLSTKNTIKKREKEMGDARRDSVLGLFEVFVGGEL